MINDPVNFVDSYGLWSISVGGYAGIGGGITFGRDPNTGQGFLSVQLGFGLGGGASYNPQGGRPGSSPTDDCSTGGFGLGLFADASFNAGPIQAGLNSNVGRNYPTKGESSLYGNLASPSASIGDSWGIRAGAAAGGQITLFGGTN